MDEIDYDVVTFYNVGILKYANLTLLQNLSKTNLDITIIEKTTINDDINPKIIYKIKITNLGEIIALLLEMKLYEKNEKNENELITPILWSDNCFSIRGGESYNITVEFNSNNTDNILFEVIGWNSQNISII